jgi:hypothetical protein
MSMNVEYKEHGGGEGGQCAACGTSLTMKASLLHIDAEMGGRISTLSGRA